MSVTIGFMLRYDQAPAAPVPPTVAPAPAMQGVWVSSKEVPPTRSAPYSAWQASGDSFPAYSSTTYGSHGEPNRPWLPQQSRIDLYA